VPVNRPASFIATKVLTNDQVSIQVLDTQNASYVINATKRDQAFYRAPITVKGKPYPHDNRDESIRTLFRFYADPKLAAFGQLIAGVNGFADAQGMDYGPREFWVKEDGWLYFGINEPTGFLATGELTTDQSADNYTPRGRNAIRVQVTIRRNGAII
ncbi:MAG: hypothetical protein HYW81_03255, partial [Parcubacteria group bacterium]|nr:hypothetical protein [Parcubacteria group bacterium]